MKLGKLWKRNLSSLLTQRVQLLQIMKNSPTSSTENESQKTSKFQPSKSGPSADSSFPTLNATLRRISQTVSNHTLTTYAELIALRALIKERFDAMQVEINLYKSGVTAIWDKLTILLELAKKRKQEKTKIAEIIASKKRQKEEEKRKKKEQKIKGDEKEKNTKNQKLIMNRTQPTVLKVSLVFIYLYQFSH